MALLPDLSYAQLLEQGLQLLIALILSLPTAWKREKVRFTAGLRTFPLVAVGATGYLILAQTAFPGDTEAQGRVLAGLLGGIGFIGGGAILKSESRVVGTATAAAIWNTGAMGAAVAYGHYPVALALAVANFLTFSLLNPVKALMNGDEEGEDGPDGRAEGDGGPDEAGT